MVMVAAAVTIAFVVRDGSAAAGSVTLYYSPQGEVGDVLVCARGQAATHVAVLCGAGRALQAIKPAGLICSALAGRIAVDRLLNMRIVGCVRPG